MEGHFYILFEVKLDELGFLAHKDPVIEQVLGEQAGVPLAANSLHLECLVAVKKMEDHVHCRTLPELSH